MSIAEQHGSLPALPAHWDRYWGAPLPSYRKQLLAFKAEFEYLATGVDLIDGGTMYGDLVHPAANRSVPLHRWFTYKEAYAAELPRTLVREFTAGRSRIVLDTFAGVGTTQLSLQRHSGIEAAYGVEWSPLAHLVGSTKIDWPKMRPPQVAKAIAEVLRFARRASDRPPALAAFGNREIFNFDTVCDLVAARRVIDDIQTTDAVRRFLKVGLAAVVEDSSGVIKDGRALRIARDRTKRITSLSAPAATVRQRLRQQYAEMLADLVAAHASGSRRGLHPTKHLRGDARYLDLALNGTLEPGQVGLVAYSPPYLNCIDYTEVYKLEAWLLELITTQQEFRETRLGTLRSHPSIDFPPRGFMDAILGRRNRLTFIVRGLSTFLERQHAGSGIGKMVGNYFDDMTRVISEQFRYLEPGGHAVCVVANSTFSRRDKSGGEIVERWRLPILTDVLLAKIAVEVGFSESYIIRARDLQPRNVTQGAARESLVIMRK